MATYKKRGDKAPKEKIKNENLVVDPKGSTTAEVFSKLDTTVSKTETLVAKNQNIIVGVVGAIALITIGYLMYQKFITQPREEEAASEMFVAQQNFQKAVENIASDSLYKLALNGSEGKFGFIKISEEYKGTDAGNLANYYAGISYLNIGKYDDAIKYLSEYSSDDVLLNPLSIGAIGDAYSEKKANKEALEYYLKAAEANKNAFTSPRFLLKAGKKALEIGDKTTALKCFTEIKETYSTTPEAGSIDLYIGLAQ